MNKKNIGIWALVIMLALSTVFYIISTVNNKSAMTNEAIIETSDIENREPETPIQEFEDIRFFSVTIAGADNEVVIKGDEAIGGDSTEALQYAVDNFDNIVIPEGIYLIDGEVEIRRPVRIVGEGSIIYTNSVDGPKSGIFRIREGGSGSVFLNIEVRSFDKYVADMPNDSPTSLTSNRMFLDIKEATNIVIDRCRTYNLMTVVNGTGMDQIEIRDSEFNESYIGVWIGDTEDILIENTYFSTSISADLYAHCIYIGYDTYKVNIKNITVEQTSELGGALLNFAWVGGDENAYYIHDVIVDGVTIKPSTTINYVIQCMGVENAIFRNISGLIKANPNELSRIALYRGNMANGDIRFEDNNLNFEELNTFISLPADGAENNDQLTFDRCTYEIQKLSTHFIVAYMQSVRFNDCDIHFGKETFTKQSALYQTGVELSFDNCQITWDSSFMRLCSSIDYVTGYNDMSVSFQSCKFIGEVENEDFYVLNGIQPHNFVFNENLCINMVNKTRDTTSINCMVHDQYLSSFNYVFEDNRFEWQ